MLTRQDVSRTMGESTEYVQGVDFGFASTDLQDFLDDKINNRDFAGTQAVKITLTQVFTDTVYPTFELCNIGAHVVSGDSGGQPKIILNNEIQEEVWINLRLFDIQGTFVFAGSPLYGFDEVYAERVDQIYFDSGFQTEHGIRRFQVYTCKRLFINTSNAPLKVEYLNIGFGTNAYLPDGGPMLTVTDQLRVHGKFQIEVNTILDVSGVTRWDLQGVIIDNREGHPLETYARAGHVHPQGEPGEGGEGGKGGLIPVGNMWGEIENPYGSNQFGSIAYGEPNGIPTWVATQRWWDDGDKIIAISHDAFRTHEFIELPGAGWLGNVIFAQDHFVVTVMDYDWFDDRILTSPDGRVWTVQPSTFYVPGTTSLMQLNKIVFMNGVYVAVPDWNSYTPSGYLPIVTSMNLTQWSLVETPFAFDGDVVLGAGDNKIVILSGQNNEVGITVNGTTWLVTPEQFSGNKILSLVYGNGRFIATSYNSVYYQMLDGTTEWTEHEFEPQSMFMLPKSDFTTSIYIPGMFVFFSDGKYVYLLRDNGELNFRILDVQWSSDVYGLAFNGKDTIIAVGGLWFRSENMPVETLMNIEITPSSAFRFMLYTSSDQVKASGFNVDAGAVEPNSNVVAGDVVITNDSVLYVINNVNKETRMLYLGYPRLNLIPPPVPPFTVVVDNSQSNPFRFQENIAGIYMFATGTNITSQPASVYVSYGAAYDSTMLTITPLPNTPIYVFRTKPGSPTFQARLCSYIGTDYKYYCVSVDSSNRLTQTAGHVAALPLPPATNGTYTLKATVSGSGTSYTWAL